MAITKIHPIVATIGVSIDYICNEKKTMDVHGNNEQLVTCIGTSKYTAQFDFEFDLKGSRQSKKQNHLAYHIVQSFDPSDGVSFEKAHKIGQELCDKLFEGKHRCVIATHMDKGHVHNHIIFCAADSVKHKKINQDKKYYYGIRTLSDKICKEHELSVIENPSGKRGKSHYEWEQNQGGNSWKSSLKSVMDAAIKESHSYEEFLQKMTEKGYEYKGEEIGADSPKFLTFRNTNGQERWTRVSEKNFGKGYTREKIKERIDAKEKWIAEMRERNKEKSMLPKDYSTNRIIDTSAEKFEDNQSLKLWATRQNMKAAQAIINKIGSIHKAQKQIETNKNEINECNAKLAQNQQRMRELAEIIRYAEQYQENEKYNYHYQKSKNPDLYLREHESQLLLYSHAVQNLTRRKIKPEKLDLEQLREEYFDLELEQDDLKDRIKDAEKENKSLQRDLDKLKEYGLLKEEETKSTEKAKNHTL